MIDNDERRGVGKPVGQPAAAHSAVGRAAPRLDLRRTRHAQERVQALPRPKWRADEDQGENLIEGGDLGLYVSRRQTITRTRGDSVRPRMGYYGKSPRSNYGGRRNI